jgi:hypothetical protein
MSTSSQAVCISQNIYLEVVIIKQVLDKPAWNLLPVRVAGTKVE